MGDRMTSLASVKTHCSQGGDAANWVGPLPNDAPLKSTAECPISFIIESSLQCKWGAGAACEAATSLLLLDSERAKYSHLLPTCLLNTSSPECTGSIERRMDVQIGKFYCLVSLL